jgi:hypothetical protein
VNLSGLRSQLAALRASLPVVTANDGAAARNAARLASINEQPEGPRRDFVISAVTCSAISMEEPADLRALLDAIGAEAIERAHPRGLPSQPGPVFRRLRREWKAPPDYQCKIAAQLRASIEAEKARAVQP